MRGCWKRTRGKSSARLPSPIAGGGARQRQREKDALDSGGALAAAADLLLSDRDFAVGAGGLRKRAGADRSRKRRRIRAAVSGRAACGGQRTRRLASICWCCFWAARSGISIAKPARSFCARCATFCEPGDALLLGTDLEKSVEDQMLAYDDPAGVTAAFNMNLLARINRELGADFDLSQFPTRGAMECERDGGSRCTCDRRATADA